MKIVDAHSHLWLCQDTEVEGLKIRTQEGGRSLFMGEIRQMLPPYLADGRNTAEIFLSNMDYAQVSAAVVTQEYIDGLQNDYLWEVQQKFPNRFLCCGMVDARNPGFFERGKKLITQGFKAIKIPAGRLILPDKRVWLTSMEMMALFKEMEKQAVILSVDLAEGDKQVKEMEEIIAEYPKLKIAVGHFGMVGSQGWKKQIALARNENVRIESGGITWLFHEEFYPYTGAVQAIKEAAEMVGIEKLMWGSDYPRTMTAITYRMSFDFVLKSKLLNDGEKQLFLGENAKAFYSFSELIDLPYIKNMCE